MISTFSLLISAIGDDTDFTSEPEAAQSPDLSIVSENELPETIDLQTATERGHTERLYGHETEMNTAAFSNADGTNTMYFFDETIKSFQYTN